MADLSEFVLNEAQNVAQGQYKGFGESVIQGAQLAQQAEAINQKRQMLEQQKAELAKTKLDKFTAYMFKATQQKDPKAKSNYIKAAPQVRDAYGIPASVFSDESIQSMGTSDDDAGRAYTLSLAVQKGDMSAADAIAIYNDPEKRLQVNPTPMELRSGNKEFTVSDAQKTFLDNQAKQAALTAQAQRQDKEIATTGTREIAKKTGEQYAAYQAQGGKAGVEKNIAALDTAIKQLKSGEVRFGTLAKKVPFGSSEDVLSFYDEKAKALVDSVRGSVNMRAALADPNPTEKQINAIMGRTIDPRLSNAENIKKLEDAKRALLSDVSSKEAIFAQHGFMTPSAPQQRQSAPAAASPAPAGGGRPLSELDNPAVAQKLMKAIASNANMLDVLAKRYGVSPTQLQRLLAHPGGK